MDLYIPSFPSLLPANMQSYKNHKRHQSSDRPHYQVPEHQRYSHMNKTDVNLSQASNSLYNKYGHMMLRREINDSST